MWFKVDDKLHAHKKARKAGKAAMGVWVMAGSWSGDNLTDGFIPAEFLALWGTRSDARKLVDAGLWTPCEIDGEEGWMFHDWPGYNPTRDQVEEERAKGAARLRKWREKQREIAHLHIAR